MEQAVPMGNRAAGPVRIELIRVPIGRRRMSGCLCSGFDLEAQWEKAAEAIEHDPDVH